MADPRFGGFLEALRREWPDYVVVAQPYTRDEDPEITHFVHVLNVPEALLREVMRRSYTLAFEHFSPQYVPFHLTTVSPKTSREYFAAELDGKSPKQD